MSIKTMLIILPLLREWAYSWATLLFLSRTSGLSLHQYHEIMKYIVCLFISENLAARPGCWFNASDLPISEKRAWSSQSNGDAHLEEENCLHRRLRVYPLQYRKTLSGTLLYWLKYVSAKMWYCGSTCPPLIPKPCPYIVPSGDMIKAYTLSIVCALFDLEHYNGGFYGLCSTHLLSHFICGYMLPQESFQL